MKYWHRNRPATLLTALLLAWPLASPAALNTVEQAYELQPGWIERWPLGDTGIIVFRPCERCEAVTVAVDAQTHYRNRRANRDISRAEMLNLKNSVAGRDRVYVYLFYRPDDRVATRVVLDAGD